MEIRKYFDKYVYYNPDKWIWSPYYHAKCGSFKEQEDWNELYRKTRMRKSTCEGGQYKDNDIMPPDFYSQERDAALFGMSEYTMTDTFGLKWYGKKGAYVTRGAPDYEGHLYYRDLDDEEEINISDYCDDNPPDPKVFKKFKTSDRREWIDIANVTDLEYHYIVDNHLFKDTYIKLIYNENESLCLYDGSYNTLVEALIELNKADLLNKLFKGMNEHFDKLKNSDREEEREFWPGKTAEEYFAPKN